MIVDIGLLVKGFSIYITVIGFLTSVNYVIIVEVGLLVKGFSILHS
jgi:hypothetical protein